MHAISPDKKKILIFIDWFWPGYKAGGPIRAVVNFVTHMQKDYDVYVFTSDRDLDSPVPYANIEVDKWTMYQGVTSVYYASPEKLNWTQIHSIISAVDPAFIYLNSLFSRCFTIYPLLISKRNRVTAKVLLAPRGMLKPSALQFKFFKKKIYLGAFKKLKLQEGIFFQATDETEYRDIKSHFHEAHVELVPDFPEYVNSYPGPTAKREGELNIIFIGRIHPIKQLDFLLDLFREVQERVLLTIVGVEEDTNYAESCKAIISSFSSNVTVVWQGPVPNHELPAMLSRHHILALPTRGENFGHAIFEALAQGKPVLISDQSPWRDLAVRKVGWDIALSDVTSFKRALAEAIQMNQEEYNQWSESAWTLAKSYIDQSDLVRKYQKLFS